MSDQRSVFMRHLVKDLSVFYQDSAGRSFIVIPMTRGDHKQGMPVSNVAAQLAIGFWDGDYGVHKEFKSGTSHYVQSQIRSSRFVSGPFRLFNIYSQGSGVPLGKSLGAEGKFGLLAFETGYRHAKSPSRTDVVV